MPADRRDLHRRIHPGRSRSARRPTCEHSPEARARIAGAIAKSEGRGRPHLHHRRPRVDLGRHDRRDRLSAGHDRAGFRRRRGPVCGRQLVLYHRRAGGQSQFSELLELEPKSDRIQSALGYAKRNLDKPLTVGQLAAAAHLSPRQFSRVFHAETGQSPAKAVENLRVEAARLMMEQSRHPIDVIARQTGFADRDRMRRAFLRAFGQPPQVIRRNARVEAAA
jgi:AraC-like DNA-binding protein